MELETEADVVRQGLFAAADDDGREEESTLVDEPGSERLRREVGTELAEPGRWGTTFTLIQSWGIPDG